MIHFLFQIPGAVEQYYKIGLVFCRSNVSVKSPKSLKELSAARVSDNMAKVSSSCCLKGCKHAAKQCKHYRGESSGLLPINSSKNKSSRAVKKEDGSRSDVLKRDNGLKAPDYSEYLLYIMICNHYFDGCGCDWIDSPKNYSIFFEPWFWFNIWLKP